MQLDVFLCFFPTLFPFFFLFPSFILKITWCEILDTWFVGGFDCRPLCLTCLLPKKSVFFIAEKCFIVSEICPIFLFDVYILLAFFIFERVRNTLFRKKSLCYDTMIICALSFRVRGMLGVCFSEFVCWEGGMWLLLGCGGYVVQKSSCHVDCNGIGGITVSCINLLFSINNGFVKEESAGKTGNRRKDTVIQVVIFQQYTVNVNLFLSCPFGASEHP